MRKRTLARELTIQLLYQIEMNPQSLEDHEESFWVHNVKITDDVRDFTQKLVSGTLEHLTAIDKLISDAADNWEMDRIALVDKNIMRLAVYELVYCLDIPPKVSINEAVNLAKKYSQEDAGKFVNGILDKINHSLPNPRT